MSDISYGIDVSHFQSTTKPAGVSWKDLKASGCSFVMVRATYGTKPDASAVAHVTGARSAGLAVGLYHFFRFEQDLEQQAVAFANQAKACGIGSGDIAPAIDIEDDTNALLKPEWSEPARKLTDAFVDVYGEAIVYMTQRDFGRMGKPAWVLERPLWVAHYTEKPEPATPANKPWSIWQHRVAPYAFNGPGGYLQPPTLDQNRARNLPRCTKSPTKAVA